MEKSNKILLLEFEINFLFIFLNYHSKKNMGRFLLNFENFKNWLSWGGGITF